MSSLWTPDGERPIARPGPGGGDDGPRAPRGPPSADPIDPDGPPDMDEEALAEQAAALRRELVNSPVEVVVANHCYGLFELAAVYLSQQPPLLVQARLAIDALGCLVAGLEGRLGESEDQLKDGLSQLRLAFVQIDGAQRAGADLASAAGANGGSAGPDPTPDAGPPEADAEPDAGG